MSHAAAVPSPLTCLGLRERGRDAEMEADMIHGILEATGIPSIMVRPAYPALGSYCVQVPREAVEAARRAIAEAQAAGPEAADEGEAESER